MSGWKIVFMQYVVCHGGRGSYMGKPKGKSKREKKLDNRKSLGLPGIINHTNTFILFLSLL